MYPMLLRPVGKDYLWGGSRLKREYGKQIAKAPLAETWECSVHPDGKSTIANGGFAGRTLWDVLREHPEYMGTKFAQDGLPILIKLIDAKKDLSVQVHPDDLYARQHEKDSGKTEMWYVLDAVGDAQIVHGFAHDVTAHDLREAVGSGELFKHLRTVKIQKDDVFFVPAGTVHGIGAGAVIAEIQQNSNITYRIYDHDRYDKCSRKRELHFEKALQVLDMKKSPKIHPKQRMIRYYPGWAREILCRCEYFEVERVLISRKAELSGLESSFQVLLCLEGRGRLRGNDSRLLIKKGECVFLPAGGGDWSLSGTMAALLIHC